MWESEKDLASGKKGGASGKSAPPPSKWSLNVWDRGEAMAIDAEGLLCQARDPKGWHGARANKGVSGKGPSHFALLGCK